MDIGSLKDLPGMFPDLLSKLQNANIFTRDDLGDLSVDDLLEIYGNIDQELAAQLIISARAHWFK